MTPADLNYGPTGLLPVVAQHFVSGQVLMVGFANQEAVERAVASREAWFFSRSRQTLWRKGETSGNVLRIVGMRVDCDADTLIYLCEPAGPTCHTGEPSCFFQTIDGVPAGETSGEAATELWDTIRRRQAAADPESSYVARLLARGVNRVAQKVGEEAVETVIAAKNEDPRELSNEVADLWFHTFILLAQQGLTPEDIWDVLRQRRR